MTASHADLKSRIDEAFRQEHDAIAACVLAELAKHWNDHRERILQIVEQDQPLAMDCQPSTGRQPSKELQTSKLQNVMCRPRSTLEEALHKSSTSSVSDQLDQDQRKHAENMLGSEGRKDPGPQTKRGYHSNKMNQLAGIGPHHAAHGILSEIVRNSVFEVASAGLIVALLFVMCAEVQYNGMNLGFKLNITGYARPGSESWPHAKHVFNALVIFFNVMFTMEAVLRIIVLKLEYLKSSWFWLDFILVCLGWIDFFNLLNIGVDPMILRLLRLIRLLRLMKVFRAFKIVDTLFQLIKSIESSFGVLMWSFLLLISLQTAVGIALCQLLHGFVDDESKSVEARKKVFEYFGTTTNSVLTMFEIVLGNWVTTCRLLYIEVSEWYGLFYVMYRCCFMFGVIKVITAVFIAETSRHVASDDELALAKKHRQKQQYCGKLKDVFRELDDSGDGMLSWEELDRLMTDDLLKSLLTTLEIDTHDLRYVFEVLDDGDNKISLQEFIGGLTQVRGPAKSFDVLKLLTAIGKIERKLSKLVAAVSSLQEPHTYGVEAHDCATPSLGMPVQVRSTDETFGI